MATVPAEAATFWTPAAIARTLQGKWLTPPAGPDEPAAGLTIDSRTLASGQVFLAIAGDRFDGHDFVATALTTSNARIAIVQRDDPAYHDIPGCLLVADTVTALQTLARAWRQVLRASDCKVIAVAGSNGKTTTRHLIYTAIAGDAVSSSEFRVSSSDTQAGAAANNAKRRTRNSKLTGTQSPKSFNNHLGVPLTLLAAKAAHDFVVVEVGSNHPGEVAALADIAQPDAAVITSVGKEHLEFFKTLDGVAKEEAAILHNLPAGGLAAVEAQAWSHIAKHVTLPQSATLQRFGQRVDADAKLELELTHFTQTSDASAFDVAFADGSPALKGLTLPMLGRHNASNALAAVAVARWLGAPDEAIRQRLASATAVEGRLQRLNLGQAPEQVTIIHDAYNANPDSMAAALHTLADQTAAARRVAILGDMFELGDLAPDEHRAIGKLLAGEPAIERVVLIGKLAMFIAEALQADPDPHRVSMYPQWTDDLPAEVARMLAPGDMVLLKASRGMQLERLLPAIKARFAQ